MYVYPAASIRNKIRPYIPDECHTRFDADKHGVCPKVKADSRSREIVNTELEDVVKAGAIATRRQAADGVDLHPCDPAFHVSDQDLVSTANADVATDDRYERAPCLWASVRYGRRIGQRRGLEREEQSCLLR